MNNRFVRSNYNRAGFSLLELLIASAIFAIISSIALRQFSSLQTGTERKQFIGELNSLVQLGWQNAIITRKVHRIMFDIKKRKAFIEAVAVAKEGDSKQKETFEPIKREISSSMSWSDAIEIRQFFLEGFDEMKRFLGKKTETIWFYIVPDGMTQAVTINFVDKEQLIDGKPKPTSLVLNPFTAEFKVYDAFQK